MTDLLTHELPPEDTGEIRGRAGLGDESTRNLGPYVAGLPPALRRPDANDTGEIRIPATIGVVDQAVAQPVAPLERVAVLDDELRPSAPGPLPSPLPAPPPAPPRPSVERPSTRARPGRHRVARARVRWALTGAGLTLLVEAVLLLAFLAVAR
jgi:hypothetical protein